MDANYIARMKSRLATMRKVASMAHDSRIIEMVTEAADQLEEDIHSLEAEARAPITIHLGPLSEG